MRSEELYARSSELSPGGVSSPVRAYRPYPLFMESGEGCRMTDADGSTYIDMCMAYGPLITGHRHPRVMDAVREQLSKGLVYGAPSEIELNLIERIHKEVPSAEMVRLACTGTEATMHAIRAARGTRGKDGIVKMNGGFHGAHDAVLVKAGSGSTESVPSSKGVPVDAVKNTHTVEYNDAQAMSDLLSRDDGIACVIMEPILGNVGLVEPAKGYLEEVRGITEENDVILIFDEVITGFRASCGGAQRRYGVIPDMTTMAKVIGGGFAGAAFMGKSEIMGNVAPQGPVYAAGTLAGNPVSAAAGLAQIDLMCEGTNYRDVERRTQTVVSCIRESMEDAKVKGCVNSVASMYSVFFGPEEVTNASQAETADRAMFDRLFRYMLGRGVYLAPSALELSFMSLAHDDDSVEDLCEAYKGFFAEVKG